MAEVAVRPSIRAIRTDFIRQLLHQWCRWQECAGQSLGFFLGRTGKAAGVKKRTLCQQPKAGGGPPQPHGEPQPQPQPPRQRL